jgi:hypothetical protein
MVQGPYGPIRIPETVAAGVHADYFWIHREGELVVIDFITPNIDRADDPAGVFGDVTARVWLSREHFSRLADQLTEVRAALERGDF